MTNLSLLGSGIDSIDVRLCSHSESVSPNITASLPVWEMFRGVYSPQIIPPTFDIPGLGIFTLKPGGRAPYRFRLSNPQIADIYLWNPDSDTWLSPAALNTGQIYINFRSNWLFFNQAFISGACDLIFDAVAPGASPSWRRVSRLDLQSTITGFDFSDCDVVRDFRSRCNKYKLEFGSDTRSGAVLEKLETLKKQRMENLRLCRGVTPPNGLQGDSKIPRCGSTITLELTESELDFLIDLLGSCDDDGFSVPSVWAGRSGFETVYFGRFTSPLYARLYRKDVEISKPKNDSSSSKEFLRDFWSENGWDGVAPVWRCEFSLSGDFLKQYGGGVSDLDLCLGYLDDIWAYCSGSWLVHLDPLSLDSNRSRSAPSECWQFIQSSWSSGRILSREITREIEVKPLTAQVHGLLSSLAARLSSEVAGIHDGVFEFVSQLFSFIESDIFLEKTHKKRLKNGYLNLDQNFELKPFDDTAFSASLRTDLYKCGATS